MRLIVLGSIALLLQAQQEPNGLLAHVRARIAETIRQLSNYMCTQTVDRSEYRLDHAGNRTVSCDDLLAHKKTSHEIASDRLRLDVGIGADGEMYSWAGENHFHNSTLSQIVNEGATQNGSFASFLQMIFSIDQAEFSYDGEKIEDGRRLAGFTYRVSRANSHYVFGKQTTAYEGTFLVDPKSFDLVRLTVRTKELPPATRACGAFTTLDYQRVHLNDSEFLLPAATHLQILNDDGSESDNRTIFKSCHQFLGDSTLSFDAPGDTASSKTEVTQPLALPEGLGFEIVLTQNIDTATAAVGDRLSAQLTAPILDLSSKILAPAGTPVTGRIVEMRHLYESPPILLIGFRLESLNIGGTSQPLTATLKSAPATRERAQVLSRPELRRSLRTLINGSTAAIVFRDPRHNLVIQSGLKSTWLTAGPAER